jgi:hypothetical protein
MLLFLWQGGVVLFLLIESIRDIVIIGAGVLMILTFAALFVFTIVLGLSVRALLGVVKTLLQEEVNPLLDTTRSTVKKVQGTATFIGENAVTPVVKVYGTVAGAKRAAGVLAGIRGRRKKQES